MKRLLLLLLLTLSNPTHTTIEKYDIDRLFTKLELTLKKLHKRSTWDNLAKKLFRKCEDLLDKINEIDNSRIENAINKANKRFFRVAEDIRDFFN